jgi:hypothetical protein
MKKAIEILGKMLQVQILKNGIIIKKFNCTENMLQSCFEKAYNIAGGMWNGKDEFKVYIPYPKDIL